MSTHSDTDDHDTGTGPEAELVLLMPTSMLLGFVVLNLYGFTVPQTVSTTDADEAAFPALARLQPLTVMLKRAEEYIKSCVGRVARARAPRPMCRARTVGVAAYNVGIQSHVTCVVRCVRTM